MKGERELKRGLINRTERIPARDLPCNDHCSGSMPIPELGDLRIREDKGHVRHLDPK